MGAFGFYITCARSKAGYSGDPRSPLANPAHESRKIEGKAWLIGAHFLNVDPSFCTRQRTEYNRTN
jgi:hypothetical protein